MSDHPADADRPSAAFAWGLLVWLEHRAKRDVSGWLTELLPACPAQTVLLGGQGIGPGLERSEFPGASVRRVRSASKKRAMLQAARSVRDQGGSHLAVIEVDDSFTADHLRTLIEASRRNPDAIVSLARPKSVRWSPSRLVFRLQTGATLQDPLSVQRVYPCRVICALSCWSWASASWDYEILVRATWAGVSLVETRPRQGGLRHRRRAVGPGEWAWFFFLNIHLSMRSITPWPHPRLRPKDPEKSSKISIWHFRRSIRRLLSAHAQPSRLGLAVALGVFLGALPLIALHSISILLAAGFLRLNKPVALAASQLCMPPLVPAICIEIGFFVRHGRFLTEFSIQTLGYQAIDRLWEWLLGALLAGPVLALVAGGVTYGVARTMRRQIETLKPSPQGE